MIISCIFLQIKHMSKPQAQLKGCIGSSWPAGRSALSSSWHPARCYPPGGMEIHYGGDRRNESPDGLQKRAASPSTPSGQPTSSSRATERTRRPPREVTTLIADCAQDLMVRHYPSRPMLPRVLAYAHLCEAAERAYLPHDTSQSVTRRLEQLEAAWQSRVSRGHRLSSHARKHLTSMKLLQSALRRLEASRPTVSTGSSALPPHIAHIALESGQSGFASGEHSSPERGDIPRLSRRDPTWRQRLTPRTAFGAGDTHRKEP